MNACPQTDRLDAYLDGDLAATEAEAFETHASACSECSDALDRSDRLAAGFAALAAETCPDDVWDAVVARISADESTKQASPDRPPARSARVLRMRWPVVAAGTLALAALALVVLRPVPPDASPDAPPIAASHPPVPSKGTAPEPTPPVTIERADPTPPVAERSQPRRRAVPPPTPTVPETPAPDLALVAPSDAPTSPEAQEARDGALLALALVADAGRHAGTTLRREVRPPLDAAAAALDLAFPR